MSRLNIVVLGTLASDPYAGMAWMHMQLAEGLRRLGHDVFYYEVTSTWPHNPVIGMRTDDPSYAVDYLNKVATWFGMGDRWAYRCSYRKDKEWYGLSAAEGEQRLASADLVLNVSAATRLAEEGLKCGKLVYFGTDPVYHEILYAQGDAGTRSLVDEHDVVVSYGENIGSADCPIPPLPNMIAKTRQPVLMDFWKSGPPTRDCFTTVTNYRQGGRDLVFHGETYHWSKHYEFQKFMDLPKQVSTPIEVATNLAKPETIKHGKGTEVPALGMAGDDYTELTNHGWHLTDAPSFTTDPWRYRDYVIASKGEFSFAKDQNIRLRSGWFSERSACYLAAGRPVITQDTAFDCVLPTGEGLFAFNTMDDAMSAFETINSDYRKHSIAAREIAQEYFSTDKVLTQLLKDLGA